MSHDAEQVLDGLGQRLKKLRLRRGLTLAALADVTGISASTLSRFETGLRHPGLEQLLPLAKVHGLTLDELVDAPFTGDPRVNLRGVQTPDGATVLPLTRRPGGIQAYKFILPPASGGAEPELRSHAGHDWLYVLNGTLRVILGEEELLLYPGEVAEFDTRTPHWFGAAGPEPVEFLSLIGRQDERAHVRAVTRPGGGPA